MTIPAGPFKSPNQEETWISERLFVRELLNHPDVKAASLARCRVPKGVTTERHSLDIDEIYIIEQGTGLMEKGDAASLRGWSR